jgi:hypothetical protein
VPPLYGFLGEGAVAFLSGFRWPQPTDGQPGAWVRAGTDAPPEVVRGVPVEQLPWWLDDELWELELGGSLVTAGRALAGDRARLVRRVDAWTGETARELVAACERRVREAARDEYADDVVLYAEDADRPAAAAAVAAYIAAHALAGGEKSGPGYAAKFERERRWQVEWLKRHLQL